MPNENAAAKPKPTHSVFASSCRPIALPECGQTSRRKNEVGVLSQGTLNLPLTPPRESATIHSNDNRAAWWSRRLLPTALAHNEFPGLSEACHRVRLTHVTPSVRRSFNTLAKSVSTQADYTPTPDRRYFVVRGRLWRLSNPALRKETHAELAIGTCGAVSTAEEASKHAAIAR